MKKMFTTIINTGGREGEVHDPDHTFSMEIAPPDSTKAGTTNPEQLFAAGYSACFNGALSLVLRRERIKADSTVSVTVSMYEKAPFDFIIGADVEGHIEGLSLEDAQTMLEAAHEVCPYSKATRGNIEVTVKAV